MTDPVPPIPVAPARRSLWDRVSLVWLVPIAAVAVAGAVAWQTLREKGPLIEIEFEDAAGVVARETELRFRNVTVGTVEYVHFTPDLNRVVVGVRLDAGIAPYVDEDAQFWIVRPEITPQRITGIETVLSGVYIEGSWDSTPEDPQERYAGLDTAPLLEPGQEGLEFTLRSTDGTLTSTMPLIYQGVTVGQVGPPVIGSDGISVSAPAVIYAPYDRLVTEATVFWDASGFSLSVGAAGAEVDFDSLSSLIVGGLAFDTFVSGAAPAKDGDTFEAYLYEDKARDSIYADPNSPTLQLSAVFSGNIAGLAVGAPVELGGLRVGEVTDVDGLIDPGRFGDSDVHLQASFAIQPSRLGLDGEEGRDEILRILQERVQAQGLRARLATGSLFGGLKVELVDLPEAQPAQIDLAALPYPALPVAPSQITDIAGTAEGLLERVDNLPVEQLLDSAISFLDNASVLVGSADTQAIPGEVRSILGDVRGVTSSEEVQQLPAQLADTLGQIDDTVTDIRGILAQVREQDAIGRTLAAVDTINATFAQIDTATEGIPDLVLRLNDVAAKAQNLPVEDLLNQLTGVSADARAILQQPGWQQLPGQIGTLSDNANAAISDARGLLADLNEGDLGTRLASAIESADNAAQAIEASTQRLPEIADRIDALVAKANDLPWTSSSPSSPTSPAAPTRWCPPRAPRPSPATCPPRWPRCRPSCRRPARAASSPTPTPRSNPPAPPPTRSPASWTAPGPSSTRPPPRSAPSTRPRASCARRSGPSRRSRPPPRPSPTSPAPSSATPTPSSSETDMTLRPVALLPLALLAGCGLFGREPLRIAVPPPPTEGRVSIGFASVELLEAELPAYADEDGIYVQGVGGALTQTRGFVWADDPSRAFTLELTRALGELTRARVAPDPWPYDEPAEARVDVRVAEFSPDLTRGEFVIRGQYYVAAFDESGRDTAREFRVTAPLPGEAGPAAIASARSQATAALARQIASDGLS
ncbi:Paraquat-inducible protein B [Rubellimicrobium mesophilum DSM 19309]|uniref:Paraquat-inducible protein B n=1 Tax=Rubellimicrobium mesophilum DSM 19309 TaxID=442562 RepID=A0A017HNY4_9RHOB|nr:ABC-type transport auxiliary lipoprotein family protein [Rubellimicrobium mesophilum]EYD75883.1 Paraquat-inducible protein B [Rubellimicrobium mesophilum DSM 19309]